MEEKLVLAARKLIVAADFDHRSRAEGGTKRVWDDILGLADDLPDGVCIKVSGSAALDWSAGLSRLRVSKRRRIFIDLKESPLRTVGEMVRDAEVIVSFQPDFVTMACAPPDERSMRAFASVFAGTDTKILGVAVPTEWDDERASIVYEGRSIDESFRWLVPIAMECGFHGMICAPRKKEIQLVRSLVGTDGLVITPNIRWAAGLIVDNQNLERSNNASEASKAGVDGVVVGKPITQSKDPRAIAEYVIREIAAAM